MKIYSKKRVALVLKMTIAIGCGTALASCGNAKNQNAGGQQLVNSLNQKISALQAARGNGVNPTTGQPANAAGGSPLLNGVWVGNCFNNMSLGVDTNGQQVGSYQEAYMFQGTAWYAEFAFWTDNSCGSNGGTSDQPQNFPNAFGAGYILSLPNIVAGPTGTLQLVAWDSTTSIGNFANYNNNWGTALGTSVNLAFQMIQGNGASNGGDMKLGDVVLNSPGSPSMEVWTWDGSS